MASIINEESALTGLRADGQLPKDNTILPTLIGTKKKVRIT